MHRGTFVLHTLHSLIALLPPSCRMLTIGLLPHALNCRRPSFPTSPPILPTPFPPLTHSSLPGLNPQASLSGTMHRRSSSMTLSALTLFPGLMSSLPLHALKPF